MIRTKTLKAVVAVAFSIALTGTAAVSASAVDSQTVTVPQGDIGWGAPPTEPTPAPTAPTVATADIGWG